MDTADSFDELNEKERYYIAKYDAVNSDMFYNMSTGGVLFGEGHIQHHTPETKAIISEKCKGKNNPFYNQKHSDSTKEKMKLAWIKRRQTPVTQETKDKMSAKKKGIKFTDEHKRKISESQKGCLGNNWGKEIPKEVKLKISNTMHTKKWITNGVDNLRINEDEINKYIQLGYRLGRKSFKKGSTTIENISDSLKTTENK